jgi:hypothetical protein
MAAPARNPGRDGFRRGLQAAALPGRNPSWFRQVSLLVGFAAVSLSCHRDEPAPSTSPPQDAPSRPAAPVAVPSPVAPPPATAPVIAAGALAAATAWLDALRGGSAAGVAKLAVVPFDYRDTRPKGRKTRCSTRVLASAAATKVIAACLTADARLHANLVATPEPRLFAISTAELPPWAAPWAKAIPAGVQPISTFVHGEGSADELVLLVGGDGVHGLWQNLILEPK